MKVLHGVTSVDRADGGPSRTVTSLAVAQARAGLDADLFALSTAAPVDVPPHPRLRVRLFAADRPHALRRSRAFRAAVRETRAEVFHGHGLWQLPVHDLAQAARTRGIPFVLAPRGMLEPGALRFSRWKKRLAGWLFQDSDLRFASCLHVTAESELEGCRRYGLRNPACVLPNGIDLASFPVRCTPVRTNATRTALFLSRIHPKKNLPALLEAWRRVQPAHPTWRLVIAGPDENGHRRDLEATVARDGTGRSVEFRGPAYEADKARLLETADLFVLPSLSENFGLVVVEALASGVPVVTTKGTPWQELAARRCGWWIEIGAEPLERALAEAMSLTDEERAERGRRGRGLVEERYGIDAVALRMISVYRWLAEGGGPPSCVVFD